MNFPESDQLHKSPAPKVKVLPIAPVKVKKGVPTTAMPKATGGFRPKVSAGTQVVRVAQSKLGTTTGSWTDSGSGSASKPTAENSPPISKKEYSFLWDIAFAAVALVFSCLILLKY